VPEFDALALAYTEAGCASGAAHEPVARDRVVETRIKPYKEQQAEKAAREEQTRVFRRNQVFGLLIVAAAICLWWLWHTNPKWIFPSGWWRF
jgi:ferric-dicitrate binding protein FerR (iron transport regulator)